MTTGHAAAQPGPVRPLLHFTPPKGWINDPNGLVWFDGEYHLFYQYYPDALVWGPMHWGHAVSPDLVHWEHLPAALLPDENGMCFSGSAVVDRHDCSGLFGGEPGLIVFYTAHRVLCEASNDYLQEQCIAYSSDRGRSWQKYAGNPVIAPPGFKDFRDPKVIWHAASRSWIMAVACGQSIRFYRSTNLLDWTLASEFGAGQGAHTAGPWECPDLFELPVPGGEETRWVLVVGVGAADDDWGSFTQYFIGDFDGHAFHNANGPDEALLMDRGRDFYAAQSWSDVADGRRLAIAWLNNWHYANQVPASDWRGAMSFPRELRLYTADAGIRLGQRFATELDADLVQAESLEAPVRLGAGERHEAGRLSGSGAVHGRLDLALEPGARVELYLQQRDYPELVLSFEDGELLLRQRREGSSGDVQFDRYFPYDAGFSLGFRQRLSLEWLIDHGSLEVLLDEGRESLSDFSIAPANGQGPVIAVREGSATLERLDIDRIEAGGTASGAHAVA